MGGQKACAANSNTAVFTAYARLWLFVEGLLHIRQPFLVPEGWWIGTCRGTRGLFPANFVILHDGDGDYAF